MQKQVDNVNREDIPATQLPEQVVERIHAVMHLFRAQQFRAFKEAEHELSHMEAKALGFFASRPGATQSELVAHSGRDKGQIARLISGLRERGLLEAAAAANDKRSVRLSVSKLGRSLQAAVRKEAQKLSAQAMQGLSEAERRQLIALLDAVRDNLERDES